MLDAAKPQPKRFTLKLTGELAKRADAARQHLLCETSAPGGRAGQNLRGKPQPWTRAELIRAALEMLVDDIEDAVAPVPGEGKPRDPTACVIYTADAKVRELVRP